MSSQESAVHADPGHGNSVAAWTAVAIMLVGFGIGCFGVIRGSVIGVVIGAVIVLLGAISWKVLAKMGYGPKPH